MLPSTSKTQPALRRVGFLTLKAALQRVAAPHGPRDPGPGPRRRRRPPPMAPTGPAIAPDAGADRCAADPFLGGRAARRCEGQEGNEGQYLHGDGLPIRRRGPNVHTSGRRLPPGSRTTPGEDARFRRTSVRRSGGWSRPRCVGPHPSRVGKVTMEISHRSSFSSRRSPVDS